MADDANRNILDEWKITTEIKIDDQGMVSIETNIPDDVANKMGMMDIDDISQCMYQENMSDVTKWLFEARCMPFLMCLLCDLKSEFDENGDFKGISGFHYDYRFVGSDIFDDLLKDTGRYDAYMKWAEQTSELIKHRVEELNEIEKTSKWLAKP